VIYCSCCLYSHCICLFIGWIQGICMVSFRCTRSKRKHKW